MKDFLIYSVLTIGSTIGYIVSIKLMFYNPILGLGVGAMVIPLIYLGFRYAP